MSREFQRVRAALQACLLGWAVCRTVAAGAESAARAEEAKPPPFATRVLPILTKAGCNAGACHGAATGQGGFKLSLLGYDPEQDYETITRELAGRRIDPIEPGQSLLLRKPTGQLEHDGGRRIKRGTDAYRTVLAWIAGGAPYGPAGLEVRRIEVSPGDILVPAGRTNSLHITAHLSDGTVEDVTGLALYSSNDDGIAEVTPRGEVVVQNCGLTAIMVRYLGKIATVRAGAPFQEAEITNNFPVRNFVDEKVFAELKRLRLAPSALSSGVGFFRRVYLDVSGRLPEPEEVRAFLAAPDTWENRVRVIDKLLASPAFVDFWTLRLSDLLLINSKKMGEAGARAYHDWLRSQMARNIPFDRMVRELLTATGDTSSNGPANFYRFSNDPRELGEYVSQTFLGIRVACARCHNHPFDQWTMTDYYQFAAYFARTGYDGNRLVARERGEVQHPKTGRDMAPRALGAEGTGDTPPGDRRIQLAAWITAPNNPMLARAFVNRVWKELIGRGLIEPVNDVRATNPASNPALLDALVTQFIAHGYDLKWLIRTVVSSGTYALSAATNENNRRDTQFFSHAYPKRLRAEVLADAIAQVTGVPERYPGVPEGTAAVRLIDAETPSYALDVFGRCPRLTTCESAGQFGGGLSEALQLINGPVLNAKLRAGVGRHSGNGTRPPAKVIEDLYLSALGRFPSATESVYWEKSAAAARTTREFLEDLLWALLNSREFAFNH